MTPIRVGVLMGGLSAEREVSLKSGRAAAKALQSKDYEVVSLDVGRDIADKLQQAQIDIAFLALHGPYGEDGKIQGLLEVMGIPYTGSGVLASAMAMDKLISKKMFKYHGLPTPDFREIDPEDPQTAKKALEDLGLPLVLKAPTQGSSIGVYIVESEAQFWQGLQEAAVIEARVMAERFVTGPELTAAVIGNKDPQVLPLIEIVSATGKYDYESKYTPGLSDHIIPPRIPENQQEHIGQLAVEAYKVLQCRGFARVDFILNESSPYILEINTLPGLTEVSLFPDGARAAGLELPDLMDKMVKLALEKE